MRKRTIGVLSKAFLISMLVGGSVIGQAVSASQIASIASFTKGVVKLHVELGQYVKKGDLLFELNQDILNSQKEYF